MAEKPSVPIVTIEIAVRTGASTEKKEENGLSHLFEHMLFKGNRTLPTQEAFNKRLRELGISYNGTTSSERVNYFITLQSKNFDAGMEFLSDALIAPLFDPQELAKELQVVHGEFDRNEANPFFPYLKATQKAQYGDQSYRLDPLGSRTIVASANRDIMMKFHKTYYIPNNSVLIVSGDVIKAQVLTAAQRYFGPQRWAMGTRDQSALPLPRMTENRATVTTIPTNVTVLSVNWNGPNMVGDEADTFVADVWGELVGLTYGRFNKNMVDSGLTTSSSLIYSSLRYAGKIGFSSYTEGSKVQATYSLLLQELTAMAKEGYFSEQDLQRVKRNLRIQDVFQTETTSGMTHSLSSWWAASGFDYYQKYFDKMDQVSLTDIQNFVRKYIIGRPLSVNVAANAETIKNFKISEAQLLESTPQPIVSLALNPKPQSPEVADPKEIVETEDPNFNEVPATEAASSAPKFANENISSFRLSNGIRTIYKHDPHRETSALVLTIGGGSNELPTQYQGLDALLMATLMTGNSTQSKDEIAREATDLGVAISQSASISSVSLTLNSANEQFIQGIEILSRNLKTPTFPESEVKLKKDQILKGLQLKVTQPDYRLTRLIEDVFFSGHPYHNQVTGTLETIGQLSRNDILKRWSELLVAGRLRLSVVTPLDIEQVKTVFEKYFDFIPPENWSPPALPSLISRRKTAYEAADLPTTYVTGLIPLPDIDSPDYAPVLMGAAILSKRFFDVLRTEHALTYAVSAGVSSTKLKYGQIYITTTQPEVALPLMRQEIHQLIVSEASLSEVHSTLEQAITEVYEGSQTAAAQASQLASSDLEYGDPLVIEKVLTAISLVSPSDIQRVMKSYFHGFTFGVLGPKPVSEKFLRAPNEQMAKY